MDIDLYVKHLDALALVPGARVDLLYMGPERRESERFFERPLVTTTVDDTIAVWHLLPSRHSTR